MNAPTDMADSAAKQPRSRLPWRIEDRGSNKPLNILYRATGLGDGYVAQVYEDKDAEFILRAVNSHDEMLAALKAAEQFIVNGVELGFIRMPDPGAPDPAHDTLPAIRAAIAKAVQS